MNKDTDLIKKIQDKKLKIVIISPHNDDAVLSCFQLLSLLNGKADITVVNVFTAAHEKPYTLSAKQFLKASGYSDANKLYRQRHEEDKKVFAQFNVSIIDLGLEDALFRQKKQKSFLEKFLPELNHLYPTYKWHISKGVPNINDTAMIILKNKLQQFVNNKNLIFAPYGIGNHVDHVLVRNVCTELFETLVYYSDFPYNTRLNDYGKASSDEVTFELNPDLEKKSKILKLYKTQFEGLFSGGLVPNHKEVYFFKKKL